MDTNKKPDPGGNRGTGYKTASDTCDSTPFALRLKALLISISTHDAALIALAVIFAALPLLAAWRALP